MHVFVCVDHNEALRHVHYAIRRKLLPCDTKFSMVHFDSHPDLMIPPVTNFFDVGTLYATLEGRRDGVAEWILPLAFQGHLSSCSWIKASWSNQMAVQSNTVVEIGFRAENGAPVVVSDEPYFVDTDATGACDACIDSFALDVVDLSDANSTLAATRAVQRTAECWTLDVCLDYFSTQNPFLAALSDDDVDVLVNTHVRLPNYRGIEARRVANASSVDRRRSTTQGLLDSYTRAKRRFDAAHTRLLDEDFSADSCEAFSLELTRGDDFDCDAYRDVVRRLLKTQTRSQLEELVQEIDVPHRRAKDDDELRESLRSFRMFLQRANSSPRIVTIATSGVADAQEDEDFTPADNVETLLLAVVDAVREAWPTEKVSVACSEHDSIRLANVLNRVEFAVVA